MADCFPEGSADGFSLRLKGADVMISKCGRDGKVNYIFCVGREEVVYPFMGCPLLLPDGSEDRTVKRGG